MLKGQNATEMIVAPFPLANGRSECKNTKEL